MNIKVLQYIDNTPKNNITTGQAAVTGDNIPSMEDLICSIAV